jgi:hypothetical protein
VVAPRPGSFSVYAQGATWLAAGWCHPSASGDPVFIPHDVEKRVLTRIDPEPNFQVSDRFPPPPHVTDSARLNLSRRRHGFEPRWDYERKGAGQTPCTV